MPRVKKSRKTGVIGTKKSTDNNFGRSTKSTTPNTVKKNNGKPAGSRHSVAQSNKSVISGPKKDPRIGSATKIDLTPNKPKVVEPKAKRYSTPAQELAALEADTRLHALLEQYDNNAKISNEDTQYMQTKMARYLVLCDLLGIKDEPEEEIIDDVDPLDAFESININDFK